MRARQCQGAGHRRRRVETGRECQRRLDGKPEQRVQLDRRGASGRQRGGGLARLQPVVDAAGTGVGLLQDGAAGDLSQAVASDDLAAGVVRVGDDDDIAGAHGFVEHFEGMGGWSAAEPVGVRESLPEFREYIAQNLATLEKESWDEAAYRWFYRDENGPLWDRLRPELNWKPYWDDNSQAKIIHFHGPKPFQRDHIESHWPELKPLTGGAYKEMTEQWSNLLREAR